MGELLTSFLVVLFGTFFGVTEWRQRSENRRRRAASERRRRERELAAERLADGLPPHERCLCSECRAWRTNPRNAELLRLRGLR